MQEQRKHPQAPAKTFLLILLCPQVTSAASYPAVTWVSGPRGRGRAKRRLRVRARAEGPKAVFIAFASGFPSLSVREPDIQVNPAAAWQVFMKYRLAIATRWRHTFECSWIILLLMTIQIRVRFSLTQILHGIQYSYRSDYLPTNNTLFTESHRTKRKPAGSYFHRALSPHTSRLRVMVTSSSTAAKLRDMKKRDEGSWWTS